MSTFVIEITCEEAIAVAEHLHSRGPGCEEFGRLVAELQTSLDPPAPWVRRTPPVEEVVEVEFTDDEARALVGALVDGPPCAGTPAAEALSEWWPGFTRACVTQWEQKADLAEALRL